MFVRLLVSLSLSLALAAMPAEADEVPSTKSDIALSNSNHYSETLPEIVSNPDDAQRLAAAMRRATENFGLLAIDDPDVAASRFKEFAAFLALLRPMSEEAKSVLQRYKLIAEQTFPGKIEMGQTSLADFEARLIAKPDDLETLRKWGEKLSIQIESTAYAHPDEAQATLDRAKAFLDRLSGMTRSEAVQRDIKGISRPDGSFGQFLDPVNKGRRIETLIGTDVAPFQSRTWVNTPPLTLADLKGKVVLGDDCHGDLSDTHLQYLRNWHEKYADKGLAIVMVVGSGSTRYEWDEVRREPNSTRRGTTITAEQERTDLETFATAYQLKFPVTVGAETIGSRGLIGAFDYRLRQPSMSVIDREGKIRMIRVHPEIARNARDIDEMLAKLLAPPAEK